MRLAVTYTPKPKQCVVQADDRVLELYEQLDTLELEIMAVPRERADDLFELLSRRWSVICEIERQLEGYMPEDCGGIKEFARP